MMKVKSFPTLYKLNSNGKLLKWDIEVWVCPSLADAYTIITRFGQVDGKIQETSDTITEGKNLGRSNETTVEQQACSEAESKWKKQFDKGYIDNKEKALKGVSKRVVKPMLAHSFDKQGHKIKYPAIGQPKLDGIRCLAILEEDSIRFFTRNGKPITSMVHIENQLRDHFGTVFDQLILDGELYNHELKHEFEQITSKVRKEDPSEGCEVIQCHIYDVVDTDRTQQQRYELIKSLFSSLPPNVKLVPSKMINEESEIKPLFESYLGDGYEGLILRNLDSKYEEKRSYNLQKYKTFVDDEFQIIGIEEGRGRLAGHASAFICKTKDGKEFKAKMEGSLDFLKKCFNDETIWKDKILTVQYQGLTGKEGVPRFPVGKAIRDYE